MKAIFLTFGMALCAAPAFATCEQGAFEPFFRAFAKDVRVQRAVLPDFVVLTQLDHDATPEPQPVTRKLPPNELDWPLVPDPDALERSGGALLFETVPQGQSVTLSGDSGFLMTLIFTKAPCWQLQSINDQSM